MVSKLSHFINKYIENKSQITFHNPYEYHTNFNNLKLNIKTFQELLDPMPALEAITALVDVPQVPRVSLIVTHPSNFTNLNDFDVFNYHNNLNSFSSNSMNIYNQSSLSPLFHEVLTNIFQRFAPMKTYMDSKDLQTYFESSNQSNVTKQRLDRIINKYGINQSNTGGGSKLHFDGFLEYYKHLSITNPKYVWNHLIALGYRNDLTLMKSEQSNQVAILDLNHKEEEGLDNSLLLPPISTTALTSFEFLDIAFENIEESIPLLIERICRGNPETSINIIQESLLELSQPLGSEWETNNIMQQCSGIFNTLADIDDEYHQTRLEFIFINNPTSIITNAEVMYKDMMQRSQQVHQLRERNQDAQTYYRGYHMAKSIFDRYDTLLRYLLKNKRIARFLHLERILTLWDWMNQYREQQQQLLIQRQQQQQLQQQRVFQANVDFQIEGAGNQEVNTIFYPQGSLVDGVPYWAANNIMIYRCKLNTGDHRWFISQIPHGQAPGTKEDLDFYDAPSVYGNQKDDIPYEAMPPRAGWSPVAPHGIAPPPVLTIMDYASETASATGPHTSDEDSMDEYSTGPETSFDC
jgi:hypothetical protein